MNKLFNILTFAIVSIAFAQAPQGFNYQATVRNSSGALVVNQNVNFKFNIMLNSPTSLPVFSESHMAPTDDLGQVNLVIGQGTATIGSFSNINWANGNYYLGIELNTGSGYVAMGTTQLLSVPYALYANTAGNAPAAMPTLQQVLDTGNTVNKTTDTPEDASLNLYTIGGSTANNYYYGIRSQIDGTNGINRAILAASNGISLGTNTGLSSYASNGANNVSIYSGAYNSTTGSNYAIYGRAYGTTGADNRGVSGYANQSMSSGVNYGLTGSASGSEVMNIAVGAYNEGLNTTNAMNYGVSARASSINTNGTNIGVYGTASGAATNYAGYFSGNVMITGSIIQPSDRKLKKEIKPIESALNKIKQLSPVSYYYNTNSNINTPSGLQYGFVAQELEGVFPELVVNQSVELPASTISGDGMLEMEGPNANLKTSSISKIQKSISINPKEEFKGINYTGLISILTEAIKEQQVLIEALKKENILLKQRVKTIENKLNRNEY